MEAYQNIGLLFYKHYFNGVDFSYYPENTKVEKKEKKMVEKHNENLLKEHNKNIYSSVLNTNNIPYISDQLSGFSLVTCYPGLFTGSGYMHEASELGELKLGFYFDYSSGLPCIPGSSVKGVLHSAFVHWAYIIEIINELANMTRYSEQPRLFKEISLNKVDMEELIDDIFGTEDTKESIYKRDLFFDSFPVSTDKENHFLKNDYITPHKNIKNPDLDPFTNPTPLQFLKILPEVEFRFSFRLTDSAKLTAKMKEEIFKQILLDLGIGAKTNVGYGQFTDKAPVVKTTSGENTEKEREKDIHDQQSRVNTPDPTIKKFSKITEEYTEDKQYKATITKEKNAYFIIKIGDDTFVKSIVNIEKKFKKDAGKRISKGKSGNYKKLEVGDEVFIRINDTNARQINFTVMPIWTD